ncbi:hypothetical protein PILCRDRAFT_14056 [Piloderma croceum F 1598]|uniref:Hemicentin-1-like von Willebrand factor A domain-containing protein n=1 Tax=Piloderma croceum (strain F 1598) TaxID=765440 RepID=A0A0C3ALV7_PILCF|nr:hypothetical protein PILCRDRAFT_14056 [Piloderma croceum F 1598]
MPGNPNVPSNNQPVNVDVVFVHDATGSQQPYIDDARQFVNNRIRDIQDQAIMKGGDARYRVIAFRDHREQGDLWTVHDSNPFTKDSGVLRRQLDALVASGGGDGPEAQLDALDAALRSSWRRDAKRIVILITDSPPHGIGERGDVVPASHPGALTPDSIRQSYKTTKTLLTVVGCNPTICQYERAVGWYTIFAKETKGKYISLHRPAGGSAVTDRALVGSVLHAVDSQRIADRWEDWIMDQSHRGHDAIVRDLHSKLAAEGEECHEVDCTEHGGHDVKYARGPISRARVDNIVGSTLRYQEATQSSELADIIFG